MVREVGQLARGADRAGKPLATLAIDTEIRFASADPGTLLAWARGDTFAFVVYYQQGTTPEAIAEVRAWSRELIDAVIAAGGTYYLPYQNHATREQFLRYARGKGAPELIVPADVLLVDRMPLLGSGKPDYVAALAMAKEKTGAAAGPVANKPAA